MERRLLATVYYSTDDDGIPPEEAMSKGTIILFSSYDLTEEELNGLNLRDFYYHSIDNGISHQKESVP